MTPCLNYGQTGEVTLKEEWFESSLLHSYISLADKLCTSETNDVKSLVSGDVIYNSFILWCHEKLWSHTNDYSSFILCFHLPRIVKAEDERLKDPLNIRPWFKSGAMEIHVGDRGCLEYGLPWSAINTLEKYNALVQEFNDRVQRGREAYTKWLEKEKSHDRLSKDRPKVDIPKQAK